MVSIEELAIIIPLVTSIVIPVMVILISKYLKSSESISRTTTITAEAIKDIDDYIINHKRETREIWQRIENIDKSLFNTCWRLDKVEQEHESARRD